MRGASSNSTLVIVTGDHGEQFGEHGLFDHGNSLYRQLIEVPLLVLDPGATAARVVQHPVSLVDLAATVLDVTGVGGRTTPRAVVASVLVRRQLQLMASEPAFSHLQGYKGKTWLSVVQENLHYLRVQGGREELYDYRRDPLESDNLIGRPEYAAVLPALRSLLDSLQRVDGVSAATAQPHGPLDSPTSHRSNDNAP